MSSLHKLASTSPLMEFDITYNKKRYRFNLFTELQVNERKLNHEVKSHASSYSFLTMLNNAIIYEYELLEREVERTYNKLYKQYKNEKNSQTGRANSDDMAKAMALSSKLYKEAVNKMLTTKLNKMNLDKAVKAFETRAFLIQTLSANVRKEV